MKLDQNFFKQNPKRVAELLLGCIFVFNDGSGEVKGRIVETEAYGDERDLACHASKGKTDRTKIMYGDPGRLYVYLNYGIFYLTNVVCDKEGIPGAVLLRSAEILEGKQIALKRLASHRFVKENDFIATGPGKLSVAFGIDKSLNGQSAVATNPFFDCPETKSFDIVRAKRVGIDYASHCKEYLWRFYIKNNNFISKQ